MGDMTAAGIMAAGTMAADIIAAAIIVDPDGDSCCRMMIGQGQGSFGILLFFCVGDF